MNQLSQPHSAVLCDHMEQGAMSAQLAEGWTTRTESLQYVEERELKHYARQGAIKEVRAMKGKGGFLMIITTQFNPEQFIVYTRRGFPRAWASLDRFAGYVQRTVPKAGGFNVDF